MVDVPAAGVEGRTLSVFPTDIVALDAKATVDITYRNRRVITGTVAGRPVELVVALPVSSGSARGRFRTADIAATWRTTDDAVTLTGTLGGTTATIEGRFALDTAHAFDMAELTGACGEDAISAHAERAAGGLDGATVHVAGSMGRCRWSLWATVAGDRRQGMVVGVIDGRPVELKATKDGDHLRFSGVCDGPDVLLLLVLGGLAFFM